MELVNAMEMEIDFADAVRRVLNLDVEERISMNQSSET